MGMTNQLFCASSGENGLLKYALVFIPDTLFYDHCPEKRAKNASWRGHTTVLFFGITQRKKWGRRKIPKFLTSQWKREMMLGQKKRTESHSHFDGIFPRPRRGDFFGVILSFLFSISYTSFNPDEDCTKKMEKITVELYLHAFRRPFSVLHNAIFGKEENGMCSVEAHAR